MVSNALSDSMVRSCVGDHVERHGSPASGSACRVSRRATRMTRRIAPAVKDRDW